MTAMPKKRLYFDMDYVLVDFRSGIDKISPEIQRQYKDHPDDIPGIFALMDPMPGAVQAVHTLARSGKFDMYILSTAPWKNPSAWADKVQWVTRHFDDVFHKRLIISYYKNLCHGDYLIDDRDRHGAKDFGGEWIHFGSERFPNWQTVLDYLLPETMLEKAEAIARKAHAGQDDKAGTEYISHPLRVAELCSSPKAKIVALLHDAIEDAALTPQLLSEQGFDNETIDAVLSVTRNKGESYANYIERAAANPLGREVKIADLEDNMDISRLPDLGKNDCQRLQKYLHAWRFLKGLAPHTSNIMD